MNRTIQNNSKIPARRTTWRARAWWVDLWRQWPWIYPRGIVDSAEQWISRSQQRLGWYSGLRSDWCEQLHPGGGSVFAPPANLPRSDRAPFRSSASRRYPPARVCYFTGAYVWSDEGVVLSRDNRVMAEFHHHFSTRPLRAAILRRPFAMLRIDTRRIDESLGLLAAPQGGNHYHWLFDVLPRVHLLSRWHPVIEKYLVPARLSAAQRESLRHLGIAEEQLLPLETRARLRCQHLYVPSLPGSEGCSPPWAIEFLRSAFVTAAQGVPGHGSRLYVSRGMQRPVLNETALIARLERRGFRAIDPTNLPFVEQVAAFRDATLVVGGHGAGLANLVFCQRASVLELFPAEYARTDCYFTMCQQMGLSYDAWFAPGAGAGQPWGAMRVDLDEIDRRLDRLETESANDPTAHRSR